ncbi:MAG TPA: type II secretion system protein [Candidatus Paceibacterota bacterium]
MRTLFSLRKRQKVRTTGEAGFTGDVERVDSECVVSAEGFSGDVEREKRGRWFSFPSRGARNHASVSEAGFTLVEMIIAVALFAVVMLIAIGALLSIIDANRKAQALQSVINNLNVALDGMVRTIREGSNYRCGSSSPSNPDCVTSGGTSFYLESHGGSSANPNDDWLYWFAEDERGVGRIYKSEDGTLANGIPITAPEVTIENMTFYVIGARRDTNGDGVTDEFRQPKVMIVIKGTAGAIRSAVTTTFQIQATAVQRVLDI